jgi:hypothetical protein
MNRAYLPFLFIPSHAAANALGRNADRVAVLALKAILQHGKSVEVAHQQIHYGRHDLAFSSRVTKNGDLIMELDLGDPRLCNRLVLEEELRQAGRTVRGVQSSRRRL